jgi:ribokinase
VIAATVLGGTSIFGGVASVIGAAVGAVMIGMIDDALVLYGLNVYQQEIIRGIIIVVAVIVTTRRSWRLDMPNPALKRLDVIGVGDTCLDIAVNVERIPRRDEKVRGWLVGKNPGGVVGNFCCAAAKFGVRTGLVTVVGDDEFGRLCVNDYRSFQADDRGIIIKPNGSTYFCFVLLDSSGEKALTIVETPLLIPAIEDIDISYLNDARYVHLCSLGLELARFVVDQLKTTDVRVSIDLESTAAGAGLEDWESILASTHVLFCNQAGLAALVKDLDEAACIHRLLGLGVKVVVVTKGACGGNRGYPARDILLSCFSCHSQGQHRGRWLL